MKTCLVIEDAASVARVRSSVAAAGAAGIDAVAPTVSADGVLTLESPRSLFEDIAAAAVGAGAPVAGLVLRDDPRAAAPSKPALASPDRIAAALECATWMGAGAVVAMPDEAVGGPAPPAHRPYEETYYQRLSRLATLRFEAQQRAVRIAVPAPADGFLLSPIEARAFIDEVNSPWVGVCLDVAAAARLGRPDDWADTLGRRIAWVRVDGVSAAEPRAEFDRGGANGAVDWPAVMDALQRASYDGPVACAAGADPTSCAARLRGIVGSIDAPARPR